MEIGHGRSKHSLIIQVNLRLIIYVDFNLLQKNGQHKKPAIAAIDFIEESLDIDAISVIYKILVK